MDPNQNNPQNQTPNTQPVVDNNYGATDFSTVSNSAPSPVTPVTEPVAAAEPQPLAAQPKEKAAPNLYPANQQIIPEGVVSNATVPATPVTEVAQQPAPIETVPQSEAVYQPAPMETVPQSEAVFQPAPIQAGHPAAQAAAQANPMQNTPINSAPGAPQNTVPQPGMPMSMGGVQNPTTPAPVSANHSGLKAYWPAIAGGVVIIIALVVFLIFFLG